VGLCGGGFIRTLGTGVKLLDGKRQLRGLWVPGVLPAKGKKRGLDVDKGIKYSRGADLQKAAKKVEDNGIIVGVRLEKVSRTKNMRRPRNYRGLKYHHAKSRTCRRRGENEREETSHQNVEKTEKARRRGLGAASGEKLRLFEEETGGKGSTVEGKG